MNLNKRITLKAAAEYAGVNYHTIRGAATRHLNKDLESGSTLECARSKDLPAGGKYGKLIQTTRKEVDAWLKSRAKPGQYER